MRCLVVICGLGVCIWWVHWASVPEGGVLLSLSATHGIAVSDLATVPFVAAVGWLVWPRGKIDSRGGER